MSNSAGAVSSIVMSLPLIAVPCLAVFGLPSIGPATAEAEADDSLTLGSADELGPASARESAAFPPIVDAGGAPAVATPPIAERTQIDPTSDHRGAAANRAAGLRDAAQTPAAATGSEPFADVLADTTLAATKRPDVASVESASQRPRSWEETVGKLAALGIRDFHLTNGDVAGEFYFTCTTPPDRSAVPRRFEAEGASPSEAAADTLQQVEQWLATR